MSEATRARPSLARRLAVASLTLALLVGGLELGSRAVRRFPGPVQPLRVGNIQLFGRHDPLLFWSLDPDAVGPDGTRWINSDGLRGPEPGPEDADAVRVLSLGESTTFAAQMEYERCYSAVLERLLVRETGRKVRVLNGGVPGYSLFQGVRFLLDRSARLDPDVVLLYFGFNDFLPVAYLGERAGEVRAEERGLDDAELFELRRRPLARLRSFLIEHSNLVRALVGEGASEAAPETIELAQDRPRVAAEDRERLLELALADARARGMRLVIVVPFYREFEEHAPLLRAFAVANDVPLVDLPALLPGRLERPRATYFYDAVHPTPAGHRLIAEAIFEVVAPLVRGAGFASGE